MRWLKCQIRCLADAAIVDHAVGWICAPPKPGAASPPG
jgi:hypothetical protein